MLVFMASLLAGEKNSRYEYLGEVRKNESHVTEHRRLRRDISRHCNPTTVAPNAAATQLVLSSRRQTPTFLFIKLFSACNNGPF